MGNVSQMGLTPTISTGNLNNTLSQSALCRHNRIPQPRSFAKSRFFDSVQEARETTVEGLASEGGSPPWWRRQGDRGGTHTLIESPDGGEGRVIEDVHTHPYACKCRYMLERS